MSIRIPHFRFVDCFMDGCTCGQPHPRFADCDTCLGTGRIIGGDAVQPCPGCSLRYRAISPQTRALLEGLRDVELSEANSRLDAQERELDLAKEQAFD